MRQPNPPLFAEDNQAAPIPPQTTMPAAPTPPQTTMPAAPTVPPTGRDLLTYDPSQTPEAIAMGEYMAQRREEARQNAIQDIADRSHGDPNTVGLDRARLKVHNDTFDEVTSIRVHRDMRNRFRQKHGPDQGQPTDTGAPEVDPQQTIVPGLDGLLGGLREARRQQGGGAAPQVAPQQPLVPGPDGVLRGREETPEQRAAREKRIAEATAANKLRREQERAAAQSEQERRTQTVEFRADQQVRRQEALAAEARAKDEARRARLGLPPRGMGLAAPQAPQGPQGQAGPSAAPPGAGRPTRPPMPTNAPTAIPTVNDITQAPPMRPVRTVEGDFRRQNLNGSDVAVPLVELTANGYPAFVPNAGALSADEFASAMTQRDSTAIGDMVRNSGDRQAMQAQRRIDLELQQVAQDQTLTPDERAQALAQVRRKQSDLHYGFLQSQGVGQGVRAGFGDVNPQAPTNEQVRQLAAQLMQQYPDHAAKVGPEAFFETARAMLEEGGRASTPGQVPMSARALGEMQAGQIESTRQQQEQQQDAQAAQRYMQQGMDPREAFEMAAAARTGDVARMEELARSAETRRAFDEFRTSRAPATESETRDFIMREVLGRDSQYNRKVTRLDLLNRAFGGDTKAQNDLGVFPGTEEWDTMFGEGGELATLDRDVRETLGKALSDPDNVAKAQRGVIEGRKGYASIDPSTRRGKAILAGAYDELSRERRGNSDKEAVAASEMLGLPEDAPEVRTLSRALSIGTWTSAERLEASGVAEGVLADVANSFYPSASMAKQALELRKARKKKGNQPPAAQAPRAQTPPAQTPPAQTPPAQTPAAMFEFDDLGESADAQTPPARAAARQTPTRDSTVERLASDMAGMADKGLFGTLVDTSFGSDTAAMNSKVQDMIDQIFTEQIQDIEARIPGAVDSGRAYDEAAREIRFIAEKLAERDPNAGAVFARIAQERYPFRAESRSGQTPAAMFEFDDFGETEAAGNI